MESGSGETGGQEVNDLLHSLVLLIRTRRSHFPQSTAWRLTKQIFQSEEGQIFDRQLDPEVFFTGRELRHALFTETHRTLGEHPEARADGSLGTEAG